MDLRNYWTWVNVDDCDLFVLNNRYPVFATRFLNKNKICLHAILKADLWLHEYNQNIRVPFSPIMLGHARG